VTAFTQDDAGVDVELSDGQSLRAQYLVGCDGGRSLIRKAAGIEFPRWDPTTSWLIAEGEMAEEPAWGFRHDALGIHALSRLEGGGPVRVVLTGISRFTDMTRQASAYRDRRVLLASDAAHVHPPWVDRASTSVCRMP
jgi:3-(3-hydroxy-phenyl)propionate hydroxylase